MREKTEVAKSKQKVHSMNWSGWFFARTEFRPNKKRLFAIFFSGSIFHVFRAFHCVYLLTHQTLYCECECDANKKIYFKSESVENLASENKYVLNMPVIIKNKFGTIHRGTSVIYAEAADILFCLHYLNLNLHSCWFAVLFICDKHVLCNSLLFFYTWQQNLCLCFFSGPSQLINILARTQFTQNPSHQNITFSTHFILCYAKHN